MNWVLKVSRRQVNGTLHPNRQHPGTPIFENIHIYSGKWLLSFYPSIEAHPYRRVTAQLVAIRGGGVISRTPRGPERAPPQWISSLRYSLFPSFQAARRRHLVPLRPGEWTPHQSDCSTARSTAPDPASRRRSGEAES